MNKTYKYLTHDGKLCNCLEVAQNYDEYQDCISKFERVVVYTAFDGSQIVDKNNNVNEKGIEDLEYAYNTVPDLKEHFKTFKDFYMLLNVIKQTNIMDCI